MIRCLLSLLFLCLAAAPAGAYTLVVQRLGKNTYTPLRWRERDQPVPFLINDQTTPTLPNVTGGSDPAAALQRALDTWPAVADISFTTGSTTIADGGKDGVNLMTFADTAANRRIFDMAGDAVAVTIFFFDGNAHLTEADVLFSPDTSFTTAVTDQEELDTAGLIDVQGSAFHELGHAIGLDHSGVEGSAMWSIASLAQRSPDADDIAGARSLYPTGAAAGAIHGTVLVGGAPAFGAQIVAAPPAGSVIATLTLPDGSYALNDLEPGSYTLYVEPLDGPHGTTSAGDCITFGNMSVSGIYSGNSLTTDFETAFLGAGTGAPAITVAAGETAMADFDLPAGGVALNPTLIGTADGGKPASAFSIAPPIPLQLAAGSAVWMVVAGPAVDAVPGSGIRFLGDHISVDPDTVIVRRITCNGDSFPMLVFHTVIDPDAPPGSRTLLLDNGTDIATLTGALRITADPACAGDCDGSGAVTVDELVRAVNVALGASDPETCTAADSDGSGTVTVDELITAVNAALSGCAQAR